MDRETERAIQRLADVFDPPPIGSFASPPDRPPGFFHFLGLIVIGVPCLIGGIAMATSDLRAPLGEGLGPGKWLIAIPLLVSGGGAVQGFFASLASRKKLLTEWEKWDAKESSRRG